MTQPTLVIGRVGFYCGSIHLTPDRAWVTDNAFITTFPSEAIDIDFLFWLLKATNLRENDNATAQPVISGKKVYPTIMAYPPLADLADAIYWQSRGQSGKMEEYNAAVEAVKTRYPKPAML